MRGSVAAAGLVGAVLISHGPALSAQALATDDYQYLVQNRLVRTPGWKSASRFIGEVLEPTTVKGYYQPLSMISLMLDYAAGGRHTDLRQFHRTNLALHAANTLLVMAVIHLCFGHFWIAAGVALLFGVHPLTVEPVVWISERKTLLAAFFGLASVICYLLYARQRPSRPRMIVYLASILFFLLALLSKPTTTLLPIALLLLDYWPLGRISLRSGPTHEQPKRAAVLLEKAPYLVLSAVFAVITIISQARTASLRMPGERGVWQPVLLVCHNIVFYLRKIVWPAELSPHYPIPDPLSPEHPAIIAGLIGTPIVVILLILSARRTPAFLVGFLIFLAVIFPTLGVVGFTNVIAADKFVYLPFIGLLLVAAWILIRAADGFMSRLSRGGGLSSRRFATWGAAGLVVLLAVPEVIASHIYGRRWSDTETLYSRLIRTNPDSYMLRSHLATWLHEQDRLDEAAEQFRAALALEPGYTRAANDLAIILAKKGRLDEAADVLQNTLRREPNNALALANYGGVLARQRRLDEALESLERAGRLEPELPGVHTGLGIVRMQQGDTAAALGHFQRAVQLLPDDPSLQMNYGVALLRAGRPVDAERHLRYAIGLAPALVEGRVVLAKALAEQGRRDEAVRELQLILRVQPNHAAARRELMALTGGG